ncbi:hypothetical protein [Stutzerimonas stutzeri]|uniref:Uncharacterized protein n=1 Tax=Stutzerimonas stutzeri TaxID=316 RepID=A0A5S5BE83_STUST|nr:hypothetical protein [Stutzerimonas stutzeri]TYP65365.1 hypothetical protein A9A72_122493 [Stutzerimonas stutzeri]
MKKEIQAEPRGKTPRNMSAAQHVMSPELLSASVITACHKLDNSEIAGYVTELKQQANSIHANDMSRPETMLIAQAHALDGLFAKLANRAFSVSSLDVMERYMRLALKAQNQTRTTLQTLAELKAPKQVAFVRQANIGNQVQVNNGTAPTRAREIRNEPNELLEVTYGERLDTRATCSAGGANPAMATLEQQHRPDQC